MSHLQEAPPHRDTHVVARPARTRPAAARGDGWLLTLAWSLLMLGLLTAGLCVFAIATFGPIRM